MRKEKYVFNDKTLQFEKHKLTYRQIAFKVISQLSAIVFTGIVFYFGVNKIFPSPKEKNLEGEISQLMYQLDNMSKDYDNLVDGLNNIHEKDNDLHRMVFGMNAIDEGVWEGGIGGHDKYEYLNSYPNAGDLIKATLLKVDKLKQRVDIQNASLEDLFTQASSREKKLASIPSIKPVRADKLKRSVKYLSGFGIRLHPVHKVRKIHKGIDFTAPSGTDIQATGDGVVVRIENRKRGYGRNVIIEHGYGYRSLYAHMKTISVKKGEKVKKGQTIGVVGSTGTSTAPHCHYEVHINGKAVDPIDYVLDGLTPTEYEDLVHMASQENQSWD